MDRPLTCRWWSSTNDPGMLTNTATLALAVTLATAPPTSAEVGEVDAGPIITHHDSVRADGTPVWSLPVRPPFAPVRAEVTADEEGVEILTFDEQGELVGALVATPNDDHIRIEADFSDGYASIALTLDLLEEPAKILGSDLDAAVVEARVAEMFAFVAAPEAPSAAAPGKGQCMWMFASLAGACGTAALIPPAAPAGPLWGCIAGLGTALCACGEYLPIEIC